MQAKDAVSLAPPSASISTLASTSLPSNVASRDLSPSSNHVAELSLGTGEVNFSGEMELNPDADCSKDDEPKDVEACTRNVRPRKQRTRRIICCTVCSLTSLAVIGSLTGLFYPRYPQWEIKEIKIEETTKMGLVRVFTDPTFNKSETFSGITASVDFLNSNYITTTTDVADFTIWFQGMSIGTAQVQPATLVARSNNTIYSTASLTIAPEPAKALLSTVMANNFAVSISVTGAIPATAFGFVTVHMHAKCDIDSDGLQLLQDTNKLVTAHACAYSIGL